MLAAGGNAPPFLSWKKERMHTHYYLASIAQLEFDALVQDTERAIQGLRCQRESVVQAIEAVQKSNQNP